MTNIGSDSQASERIMKDENWIKSSAVADRRRMSVLSADKRDVCNSGGNI